jgi:hypothetical protein
MARRTDEELLAAIDTRYFADDHERLTGLAGPKGGPS